MKPVQQRQKRGFQSHIKPVVQAVLAGITFFSLLLVTLFLTRSKPSHQQSSATTQFQQTPQKQAARTETKFAGAVSAVSKITPQDYKKAAILDEILGSGNDNDIRLDKDLRKLTSGAKTLFEQRYQSLPGESLNERGTIVFLLGRNISTESDIEFLAQVLNESPCLSLAACSSGSERAKAAEDTHHEAGNEVTLAYPQLQSLKAFEAYIKRTDRDPDLAIAARQQIESARQSPVPLVARMAQDILQRLADNG